jgi:hypothetical protein
MISGGHTFCPRARLMSPLGPCRGERARNRAHGDQPDLHSTKATVTEIIRHSGCIVMSSEMLRPAVYFEEMFTR